MATIKTLAAILPLLAFAPAAAEESAQPAYVMPQIPSEAEKIAALKLGYQINGNSMVKIDSSIDLTALTAPAVPHDYRRYKTRPVIAPEAHSGRRNLPQLLEWDGSGKTGIGGRREKPNHWRAIKRLEAAVQVAN